ncbi:hypothetical protein P7C70_g3796, partial [Phenoliferia sp. Uapishka_3]
MTSPNVVPVYPAPPPELSTLIVHDHNPQRLSSSGLCSSVWSPIVLSNILPHLTKFISFTVIEDPEELKPLMQAMTHLPSSTWDCERNVSVTLMPTDEEEADEEDDDDDLPNRFIPGNNQATRDLQLALAACSVSKVSLGEFEDCDQFQTLMSILPHTISHLCFEQSFHPREDVWATLQKFVTSQTTSIAQVSIKIDHAPVYVLCATTPCPRCQAAAVMLKAFCLTCTHLGISVKITQPVCPSY